VRPAALEHGYRLGPKLLFRVVRLFSGRPLPDAARLTFYRPDFYGRHMKQITHAAMRGPSAWSVAERELMAAHVSTVIESPFCVGAHTATAARAYDDRQAVEAVLADPGAAQQPLRATLELLGTLAREGTVTADDMRAVLAAGASREQIVDALAVLFAFGTTARLANAFAFSVLDEDGFEAGAKYLLKRGYL
jgi:AhpD family alkylhydroperoxidase